MYLDNGCSNNVTRNKSLFKTLVEFDGGDISVGENFKGKSIYIVTIFLKNPGFRSLENFLSFKFYGHHTIKGTSLILVYGLGVSTRMVISVVGLDTI